MKYASEMSRSGVCGFMALLLVLLAALAGCRTVGGDKEDAGTSAAAIEETGCVVTMTVSGMT